MLNIDKSTNVNDIKDTAARNQSEYMLERAKFYASILEATMSFEDFKDLAETYLGEETVEEIENGYIDENNYSDSLSQLIFDDNDNYGIEVTYSIPGRNYVGAEVTVEYGGDYGPHIWIDTKTGYIRATTEGITMAYRYVDTIGFSRDVESIAE